MPNSHRPIHPTELFCHVRSGGVKYALVTCVNRRRWEFAADCLGRTLRAGNLLACFFLRWRRGAVVNGVRRMIES